MPLSNDTVPVAVNREGLKYTTGLDWEGLRFQ